MKLLKQLLTYLIWTALALLLGIIYMRIILGSNTVSKEGLGYLFDMFHNWGLVYVGAVLGLTIAALFILLDVFYLKKKLSQHKNTITIRFMVLVAIAVFAAGVHYVLEKVIDVI